MNKLPVMEYFYSIQGEGYYSGRPAFFIRLAGCDVGCVWCDVKESWEAGEHKSLSVDFLVDEVQKTKADFVVITGGEPAMYDLSELTEALKKINCYIAIETSGVYPLRGDIDWVCFSPKKFKKPLLENYAKADEIKCIVFNKSDFEWAEQHLDKLPNDTKHYLQVEWSKREQLLPLLIDYVKEHPHWSISTQVHKYIDVP